MQKCIYIIVTLLIALATSAEAKINGVYSNKQKVNTTLHSTLSGEYISLSQMLKLIPKFQRENKYTIALRDQKIIFYPSAIFVRQSSQKGDSIIQLSKPINLFRIDTKEDIFLAVEDFVLVLNAFGIRKAKILNNDVIIDDFPPVASVLSAEVKHNDAPQNDVPKVNVQVAPKIDAKIKKDEQIKPIAKPATKKQEDIQPTRKPENYEIPPGLKRRLFVEEERRCH